MYGTIHGIGFGQKEIRYKFKSKTELINLIKKIEYNYEHYELDIHIESD